MNAKNHPDYHCFHAMRRRCYYPLKKDQKYYKDKGITVCKEWHYDFWQFNKDMGDRPSKDYSIDRIDSNKGYYKENCRWATRQEQTDNRITKTQCMKGHVWTKQSTTWINNKKGKTRRCKICLDNYMKKRTK